MTRTHGNAAEQSRRQWLALAGVVLVSVSARIVAAMLQGDTVVSLPGVNDQVSYDALARRVAAGAGFSFAADWWPATRAGEPTAHWSYLYTLYLAGVYSLTGMHPLVARLAQAIVAGVIQPWLVWRLGCRVFGQRVGLIAAGLTAGYAYFVYYASALITETFYTLAVLWMLDLAIDIALAPNGGTPASRRWRDVLTRARPWVALGLALGLAALLRQVILLFVPVLAGWLILRRRRVPMGLALSLVVVALLIAPWTVRNYSTFGRFVLLNSNAGYAFFWANHPVYGDNFVAVLSNAQYASLIPEELRGLDEASLDQALLQDGLRFVADDPIRYIRLSISRTKDYFEFWPSAGSPPLSNAFRLLSFGITLPFVIYGLLVALTRPGPARVSRQPESVGLLYLFISTYTTIHLLSWALIRYRVPVDAVLVVFAALAIADLIARLRVPTLPLGSPASACPQCQLPARQGS
jgi:hypothetical protein